MSVVTILQQFICYLGNDWQQSGAPPRPRTLV
jgi:hypothetical protein